MSLKAAGDRISDGHIIARFAPSPTGISHAGNIYAYLLTWLIAKSQSGEIVCRIEDLDGARSRPEYIDSFLTMLQELGLTFDRGPYFQSDNKVSYKKVFGLFDAKGLTYPCFCTRRDLSFQSAPHESDGIRVYDRRCMGLTEEEIASKTLKLAKEGRHPSFRLRTDPRNVSFDDVICGQQESILDKDCGDFIIKRADDEFAYNLAVVVDDIEEGVNLVSRGRDLLGSTPQQIYIYELLGEKPPTYVHFPLICAKDGRRLAKRDEDATYDSLKVSLGTPKHVLGHIAYITGLQEEDAPATPYELLEKFDMESMEALYKNKPSITFDP